ncbi:MAG: hypothetical protein WA060_03065 [Minisyncoccia bacterium]
MKREILLKSFLILILMVIFASFAQASETRNNFSSDGTALGPEVNDLAIENDVPTSTTISPVKSPSLTATVLDELGDLGASSSFWVVFILLILFVFFIYLYRRPLENSKTIRV